MKILHVGKYYPPFRGGMETVLQNLAEGLLDAGCEVALITAGSGGEDAQSQITGPETGRSGTLTRAAVQGTINSQPVTLGLTGLLRRTIVRERPDLVQLHLPNPLAAAAWLVLQALGPADLPPMCVWYHADITRQRLGRRLVGPLISACLARANGICVSSESLKSRSPVLREHRAKVSVVPFGIDPKPWCELSPRHDGPFLFVGRLVPYKGLHVLLAALAETPGAQLVVAGEGPEESALHQLAARLGVAARVEFAGALEVAELVGVMESARALVLPSIDASETFGLVQLEAMAAGLPVVATDLPTGVPEVGIPGETGLLVPPGDKEALAKALKRLQNDRDLCRRFGAEGRLRFEAKYSRQKMVARLLVDYEQMINGKPERKGTL